MFLEGTKLSKDTKYRHMRSPKTVMMVEANLIKQVRVYLDFQHLKFYITPVDSPFVNVLFDDLARRWHSFVRVWHFDRGAGVFVEVCFLQGLQVKYGYRLVREMEGKTVEEGEREREGGREGGKDEA